MKKTKARQFWVLLLLIVSAVTGKAQPNTGMETTHDESGFVPEGYQLDWNDEFDGSELNTNDWKFEIQEPGWVNNELQRYVGKTYRGNKVVFVEDGHLTIRAQKVEGQIVSGRINARPSQGWRYGYFEARIKLPKGKNPNDPFTIADTKAAKRIEALPENERDTAESAELSRQWRNKGVSDTYIPGSVFKMVMANNRPPVMRIIFQSKKGYLIASFKSFFNGSNILSGMIYL